MSTLRRLILTAAVSLLAACATTKAPPAPPAVATPAPAATPARAGPAANDNLNAVAWTQTAVEHDLVYREVYRQASEKLLLALKDRNWDALPRDARKNRPRGLKPAVIVDIDETVLDNSPYQARLVRDGKSFDEYSWSQWCREKAAKALPGALEFTRFAARHGVTVFYLSNRAQDLNEATLDNLRAVGFPLSADETVFLGLGTVVEGCEQVGSEKGCRRELVGRRHRVLLQLGDQLGDFVDVLANTPQGRRDAVAGYLDWFGERWFVLPNPTYGSWEPALFNNEWSKPESARRLEKRENLRY
ncbi:5'-nucleotidase, lipoprotein e(P4) family [Dokdonella sp.]|uniref:5'-nucleotidase, lipoprotein e(P4) family n=1 Tax=Dokdonella sp. TaxID=2291710 RepID=UPI003784B5F5